MYQYIPVNVPQDVLCFIKVCPAVLIDLYFLHSERPLDCPQEEYHFLMGSIRNIIVEHMAEPGQKLCIQSNLLPQLPTGSILFCLPSLHMTLGNAPKAALDLVQQKDLHFPPFSRQGITPQDI